MGTWGALFGVYCTLIRGSHESHLVQVRDTRLTQPSLNDGDHVVYADESLLRAAAEICLVVAYTRFPITGNAKVFPGIAQSDMHGFFRASDRTSANSTFNKVCTSMLAEAVKNLLYG